MLYGDVLDFEANIRVEFLKVDGRWYIEVYDKDCPEGCAPSLLLDDCYSDEDIDRIISKWIPNTSDVYEY